jgi:hypothetical protein
MARDAIAAFLGARKLIRQFGTHHAGIPAHLPG